MGSFTTKHHWGKDHGCDTVVAHVRRLAEANGFWAVPPAADAHFGRMYHTAIQRYGCLPFFGQDAAGDEYDVLVLLADRKGGDEFLAFLEDLLGRFRMSKLVYGEGFDTRLMTLTVRCTLGTWDGTVENLSAIYGDLAGLTGFTVLGVYDNSLMRRLAESRRSPGP